MNKLFMSLLIVLLSYYYIILNCEQLFGKMTAKHYRWRNVSILSLRKYIYCKVVPHSNSLPSVSQNNKPKSKQHNTFKLTIEL